jgi:uncharacterized RDD family membrane protein YckC
MSSSNPYAPPRGDVRDVADGNDQHQLAGRGTRLLAFILDGLIGAAMFYAPLLIVVFAMGGFGDFQTGELNFAAIGTGAIFALLGLIAWILITVRNVVRNGQSIAKRALGIKVVRRDGSRASLGRIFWLRNAVNAVLGVIPLYGLIDALLIFGEERQCVHDKLADTIVVNA